MVYYGLLLFFVLEYVRPGSYVPAFDALHLNAIVPLTVFIGSVFTKQIRVSEVFGSPNARWIMFLLFLLVLSGLTCDVQTYALDVFTKVIGYSIIFFVLKKEIYDLNKVQGVLATLVMVHLVIGVLNPDLFSGDGQRHYIASGNFLGDGNDFALSVNVAIPFCLFLTLVSQGVTRKLFYAAILVILILAVVATQSRGGILGLASVGLYCWVKSDRKILGMVGVVLVIALIFSMAPAQFFDRMETLTKVGDEMEGSAQGRIWAWKAALGMASDHPILGVGAGHFPVKYGSEYQPEGLRLNAIPWVTAHSSYFLLLGELGIPGIIFLIGIIVFNLMAGERMLREMKTRKGECNIVERNLVIALNASLIAFAVGGAFISAAYYPHIYVLAGLLECGRETSRKSAVSGAIARKSQEENSLPYRGVPI